MTVSKHFLVAGAAAGLLALAPGAHASTLSVSGGNGLDGGELCAAGNFTCPATPIVGDVQLGLSGSDPVTGSFSFNPLLDQLSFSLTLTQNATFTDGTHSEVLQAGSSFTGTNLSVSAPAPGDPSGRVSGSGGIAAASLYINSALVPGNGSVLVQSISCTTAVAGQCGLQLGGLGGGLSVDPIAGASYIADLTFNVNVTPVPLPAGLPMLLCGFAGLGLFARRRRVAPI